MVAASGTERKIKLPCVELSERQTAETKGPDNPESLGPPMMVGYNNCSPGYECL